MDLQDVEWKGMDSLVQDWNRWRAFVNAETILRVPQNVGGQILRVTPEMLLEMNQVFVYSCS